MSERARLAWNEIAVVESQEELNDLMAVDYEPADIPAIIDRYFPAHDEMHAALREARGLLAALLSGAPEGLDGVLRVLHQADAAIDKAEGLGRAA